MSGLSSRPSAARSGQPAKPAEYLVTESGNRISRRAGLVGTSFVTLGGKTVIQPDVILRGDLHRPANAPPSRSSASQASGSSRQSSQPSQTPTSVIVGKYTVIGQGCVIHPPYRVSHGQLSYYPLKIGENVFIGPHCQISASGIGSHVHIGAGSVLQPFCVVRDSVKILPGTVVPSNMVIPPGVIVGGQPAQIIADLPDGWGVQSSVVQGPADSVGIPIAMTAPATAVIAAHQAQLHLHTPTSPAAGSTSSGTDGGTTIIAPVPVTVIAATADMETPAPQSSVWVEGGDLRSLVRAVK